MPFPVTIDDCSESLNLHAIAPRSRANGPGVRTVIWFQGCSLGCPGCFNPQTHSFAPAIVVTVFELIQRLAVGPADIEGITISGGEPLQQPRGLLGLLSRVRARTRLSVVLFSGYSIGEIRNRPAGQEILRLVDVLIDGRYMQNERLARGLRGSLNQRIRCLTNRYSTEEIESTPPCEVRISANGKYIISGIRPVTVAADV